MKNKYRLSVLAGALAISLLSEPEASWAGDLMAAYRSELSFFAQRMNTYSPRLDSLQLNWAIRDEGNVIGLEKFGGNPAGILMDEPKSRLAVGGGIDHYQKDFGAILGGNRETDGYLLGLLGVARTETIAVQVDSSYQDINEEGVDQSFKIPTASLAYNQRLGDILVGGELSHLKFKDDDPTPTDIHTDPPKINLGAAHVAHWSDGNLQLGVNASQLSYDDDEENTKIKDVNAQTVLNLGEKISAGVFGFYSKADLGENNMVKLYDLTFRGFWELPNLPVQLGGIAAWQEVNNDGNVTKMQKAGLGLTLVKKEVGLLGIEANLYRNNLASETFESNQVAIGGEFHFFKRLTARASAAYDATQRRNTEDTLTLGAGLGLHAADRVKFDISLLNATRKATEPNAEEMKVDVLASIYF